MGGIFTAIKRFFIYIGILAERASETDAINEAIVEREIRDHRARADGANKANGDLNGTMLLLDQQIKEQIRRKTTLQYQLDLAAKQNDEANGAIYAEELATLEEDTKTNQDQYDGLKKVYQQNVEIIGESLRQISKTQREFSALKAQVKASRNLEGLSELMKTSIADLQGMVGGEGAAAMQRMRENSVKGQGHMNATLDLAKQMGSDIRNQQEARKARGKALFAEYKAKQAGAVQATETPATQQPERQKMAVAQ